MKTRASLFARCLLAAIGTVFCSHRAEAGWNDRYYSSFSAKSFRSYAPAQQTIRRGSLDANLLAAAIFYASNERRSRNGASQLLACPPLKVAATGHSREMAEKNFFSHDNPSNRSMKTPWKRMAAVGITGGYRSENIASVCIEGMSYLAAADKILNLWMNSAGHRGNLLDRNMHYLGCGIHPVSGGVLKIMATQDFASDTGSGVAAN